MISKMLEKKKDSNENKNTHIVTHWKTIEIKSRKQKCDCKPFSNQK